MGGLTQGLGGGVLCSQELGGVNIGRGWSWKGEGV